jgi:hypothetical protein
VTEEKLNSRSEFAQAFGPFLIADTVNGYLELMKSTVIPEIEQHYDLASVVYDIRMNLDPNLRAVFFLDEKFLTDWLPYFT